MAKKTRTPRKARDKWTNAERREHRIISATKNTNEYKWAWDEGSANKGLKFVPPRKNAASALVYFGDRVSEYGVLEPQEIDYEVGGTPAKYVTNKMAKGIKSISVNVDPYHTGPYNYVEPRSFDYENDWNIVRKTKKK